MYNLLLAIIYLAFIGLGLPDSLLGAAWPAMYKDFDAPLSLAGPIAIIISVGTIVSSLQSDRLTKLFGTGKVTALSVGLTAIALFGFSVSDSVLELCLWAIPYGLGAGSVDASINNYVAVHHKSHHMSWLHCMWGLGAAVGPYIMGAVLAGGGSWNSGYRAVTLMQVALTVILLLSVPLWKDSRAAVASDEASAPPAKPLPLRQVIALPGAKALAICFFCYCAVETTAILWTSSYFSLARGTSADTAATYAGMFFVGITIGRGVSGFVTMKLSDTSMIRLGQAILGAGIFVMMLPFSDAVSLVGLVLIGLGCAPIYPCIIHAIASIFGADKSQAVIGVQMASAYVGPLLMPPLFGVIANNVSVVLLPAFLLVLTVLMVLMHEKLLRGTKALES